MHAFTSVLIPQLLTGYRFINARRRIVQPMIDQSNRAGPQNGTPGTFSPDSMGYPGPPQAAHG